MNPTASWNLSTQPSSIMQGRLDVLDVAETASDDASFCALVVGLTQQCKLQLLMT